MPADTLEILEGDEEGIERRERLGAGRDRARRAGRGAAACVFRRCLRVYDENRRFAPVFDDAERLTIACDTVLLSVGQAPDLAFLGRRRRRTSSSSVRAGRRSIRQTLATTAPGVFVAGDLAHGTRLLIDAVASGKAAARSVYRHLTGRRLASRSADGPSCRWTSTGASAGYEAIRRVPVPTVRPTSGSQDPSRGRARIRPAAALRGVALSRLRRDAGLRRQPLRALRRLRRRLPDAVPEARAAGRSMAIRCVLCGGCADVCPTLCLKLTPY